MKKPNMFSCSTMFSKTDFATVSNLRFSSRTNFMLSCVEYETKFYNHGACFLLVKSGVVIISHSVYAINP